MDPIYMENINIVISNNLHTKHSNLFSLLGPLKCKILLPSSNPEILESKSVSSEPATTSNITGTMAGRAYIRCTVSS